VYSVRIAAWTAPQSRLSFSEKIQSVNHRVARRSAVFAVLAVLALGLAVQVNAQFRRSFSNERIARADDFDGGFQFCRVVFRNGPNGDFESGEWYVDYPRADINLSIRLSELTKANVSRTPEGDPKNVLIQLASAELFNCPFIMMTEVGAAQLSSSEITHLREYLQKGGFLWADDFWGTDAWEWWATVMGEVLPRSEYPIVELTTDHPLFHAQFVVKETPQIANIGHWTSYGDGMERGSDSPRADPRAIFDRHGNIMVLMTHNTDFGDSFEREGDDPQYFLHNSVPGYAFGINALLYAMTH
jgi:hypothetical protein